MGKGAAPEGKKATVTLVLNDAEFQKLIEGKANAQKLFMGGKLKIKGNMMKYDCPVCDLRMIANVKQGY